MFIFTNVALIITLFINVYTIILFALRILFVAQAVELAIFVFRKAKQISEFLEIRIFCVNNQAVQI